MKFEWTGDPAQDFDRRSVNEMEPNILYIQMNTGRLAIIPETDKNLVFLEASIDKDAPYSRNDYRKEKLEFVRAAGRTIPVFYNKS
ncbi:MAG: hypothetical protein EOO77_33475 [Oxalobacteraceae bacterium]|jgi:hypothetical protein|nr:MAG: hypothetical protein EOO77_33475 [Oxalobacteraceae bacterium]